ncbi:thiol reductant ABC exporter subunit CydC [Aquibaculum arenosum]|uniref:Thiol reductant ABC exporter subunit CydC n=1 Tax=Aquibaculum arenosum TaxID=3032591 RepID=A0ABT5YL48_9PROT|nr:thiol reductant ABC exporter subunit CydC [Fodinicurvata sp. CAU 1616]MDF2095672.1 thiol reductant ABC exporter subunit CydC [Fodinicurvata sp. CAU 1616]
MKDLLFFLRLAARRRLSWMLAGALLTFTTLLAGTALLTLSGWFISAAALAGLAGAGAVFNFFVPSAGVRFFAIGRILSRYGERLVTHEATLRVLADLRVWFFRKAIPLAPARLGGLRSGEVVARVTSDIEALDNLYLRAVAPAAAALLLTLIAAGFLALFEPRLALVLLAAMGLAGVAVPLLIARLARRSGKAQARAAAELRGAALDGLQGAPELLAHGASDRAASALESASLRLSVAQRRQASLGGLGGALILFTTGLALVLLLLIAAQAVAEGRLSPPLLAMAALLLLGVFEAAGPLARACQSLGQTRFAARRLRSLAETEPAVRDCESPQDLPPGGDLAFERVSFAYGPDAPPVLHDLSLTVTEGERVAILGESGSGKSTLAHLLLRLWDPQAGRVLLAGTDISRVRQAELHQRIAFLSQDTPIFSGSLRENLLLGDPEAEEARLWEALDQAGLADFVAQLPEGLESWVGETGVNLSGGQGRRLALARALLKPSAILLLDEPTQGLDASAERAFFATLAQAARGRTLVLITHAQHLEGCVERVYRLDKGRLQPAP